MLKSSGAMGAATLSSRLLGMVREILYARFMGDGPVAGAFKLAFMVPNLFRRLLGEGALTAAFIPIFKEKERTSGEAEMWRAANVVISGLIVAATVIIGIVLVGVTLVLASDSMGWAQRMGPWIPLATNAPAAFPDSPVAGWLRPETRLMLELLRVMFPYMLLVCLAAIFMGMLNARGHFFVPAMGAAVLNGVLIVTVVWVAPNFGKTIDTQIFALAFGVLVAGVAQALYQLPILWREGFRYQWISPWHNETVRQVVRKMIPGMLGIAAFQLNVLVTQGLASMLDWRIVASFDYAVRLMELPQGVFGISLATYLLPTLSGLAAEKKFGEFRITLNQALGFLIFANLIASVLLMVLAEPIVRLLFERGEFNASSTHRAAFALACLAPGLIAFSMVNILARAFYALGDTQTPMKISCFCLLINIAFVLWLVVPFAQGGLGIANTMSAAVNVGLLLYALRRKLKHLDFGRLREIILTMLAGAVLGGVAAWLSSRLWENWIGHGRFDKKFGAVFVPIAMGSLVYFIASALLRVPQARQAFALLRGKSGRGRTLEP